MSSPKHPVPPRVGALLLSQGLHQQNPQNTSTSPVTDLANNLCGLSTSSWGTPRRRISWNSEGTPEFAASCKNIPQDSLVDSPMSVVDSPMFHDRLLRDVSVVDNCLNTAATGGGNRAVRRVRTLPAPARGGVLLKDSPGKENAPKNSSRQDSGSPHFTHLLPKKPFAKSSATLLSDFDSQDSGFGLQEHPFLQEPFPAPSHPPPRRTTISPLKPQSSLKRLDSAGSSISCSSSDRSSSVGASATDDDIDDGFLDGFDMDAVDLEGSFSQCVPGLPAGMQHVLEAPLQSSLRFEEDDQPPSAQNQDKLLALPFFFRQRANDGSSLKKPPIRRCLSMVVESPLSSRPALSPKEKLLQAVDRNNNNSGNSLRRPEDTRKRFLQEDAGEEAFKKPCEPPFCAGVHRSATMDFLEAKRRKSVTFFTKSPSDTMLMPSRRNLLQRSHSEADTISRALQSSSRNPNLIGDCSGNYALPLVKGRHDDLKTITSATLSELLEGKYSQEVKDFKIVDCRYPYEFIGGHINGALNIYTKESVMEYLIRQHPPLTSSSDPEPMSPGTTRSIIVFHCEFSSERGPKLCRYLRNMDREANKDNYPLLFHPEIYLLEGGYKDFYSYYKDLCTPQDYLPMLHKDHEQDLRKFRAKSKSWSGETKSRLAVRPGLKL